MRLKVRALVGKSGQRFILQRKHPKIAIEALRKDLTVLEKGKDTNILSVTFLHSHPHLGEAILNAILDQYIDENTERKTAEASRTLSFLQQQIAESRDRLGKSEKLLGQSRAGSRTSLLGEEARLVLQRSVDLEKEILAQKQKRADLLRTYQERSDVVLTLDQQIAKLQEEGQRLNDLGKSLPRTQQEVIRLTRDVQVNQGHYNTLRNLEAINLQQLQMAKAGDIRNARIVDRAMPSLSPVKPKKFMVIGLGTLLGALTGVGLIMLLRSLHPPGVEDPQVLEAHFDLPILATIPHSKAQTEINRQAREIGGQVALLANTEPKDIAVESLRSLRTSLHFTLVDTPNRAIMFAGASPEIGKSFVGANFAVVLAQYGARVLLVDADMRKGKLHRHFGNLTRKDGLSEILVGNKDWREVLHRAHEVDMISTGTLPPNPSKLLYSERFVTFLKEVCAAYDYVIVDAPPILAVTDATIIGPHIGGVVLVVKDGQHPLGEIRAALQCLEIAGIRAKGFVFNDLKQQSAFLGYRRNAYHYNYQS
jgi:tyrosine-protein kinase Etk/Wzc